MDRYVESSAKEKTKLNELAVFHGKRPVAEGGEGGVVGDDDDGLAEAVAKTMSRLTL